MRGGLSPKSDLVEEVLLTPNSHRRRHPGAILRIVATASSRKITGVWIGLPRESTGFQYQKRERFSDRGWRLRLFGISISALAVPETPMRQRLVFQLASLLISASRAGLVAIQGTQAALGRLFFLRPFASRIRPAPAYSGAVKELARLVPLKRTKRICGGIVNGSSERLKHITRFPGHDSRGPSPRIRKQNSWVTATETLS